MAFGGGPYPWVLWAGVGVSEKYERGEKAMEPCLRSRSFWNWRVKLLGMLLAENSGVTISLNALSTSGQPLWPAEASWDDARLRALQMRRESDSAMEMAEGMGFLSLTGPDAVLPCFSDRAHRAGGLLQISIQPCRCHPSFHAVMETGKEE